jgi:hypothetical protein
MQIQRPSWLTADNTAKVIIVLMLLGLLLCVVLPGLAFLGYSIYEHK